MKRNIPSRQNSNPSSTERPYSVVALVAAIVLFGFASQIAGFVSNEPLTPENSVSSLMVLSAALVAAGMFASYRYVGSVHPFWIAKEAPTLKPFVYITRGTILLTAAILMLAFSISTNAAIFFYTAGVCCGLAAGLDFFVFGKARSLESQVNIWEKDAERVSGKLDTGRLAEKHDMKQMGLFNSKGLFLGSLENQAVFFPKDGFVHAITYGEPGCGKGINTVVPNLMAWDENLVAIDPKGELAAMTADYRKRHKNQEVIYLNPWKLHGLPNTPFNPLQIILDDIKEHNKRELDDATLIAEMLVPEPATTDGSDDKNGWIRQNARALLKTLILFLAIDQAKHCNLVMIRRILTQGDQKFTTILAEIASIDAFNGELAALADTLINLFVESRQQFEYARDDALRALSIYDNYGDLGKAVSIVDGVSNSVICKKPVSVFIMIPKHLKKTHSGWMKLVIMNFIEAVGRYGNNNNPVLCMLDEFANLGKLPDIDNKLAEYRGNGLRCWLIVQSRPQLETVYGKNLAAAIEGYCGLEQYLSVRHPHAKELSDRIGERSVKTSSTNVKGSFDDPYQGAQLSYQETLTPVLPPRKITELKEQQLVFLNGTPMLLNKSAYWDLKPWNTYIKDNPIAGPVPNKLKGQEIDVSFR